MKKIYSKAITLSIILGTIIISLTFFFNSGAFAWLARQNEVSTNGMQTQIKGTAVNISYSYRLSSEDEFAAFTDFSTLFKNMLPGDRAEIRVEYENTSNRSYTVNAALECPDGGEVPLVIDGKYYYFSTQLRVLESDKFLTTPPTDKISSDTTLIPNIVDIGSLTLDPQGEGTLEFTIEFINYATINQNAYQKFGNSGGNEYCNRVISSTID